MAALYALAEGGEIKTIRVNIIRCAYHMRFIPAIIGVYLSSPIIQKIVESRSILKYYLKVAFIFVFIIPYIFQLVKDFGMGFDSSIIMDMENLVNNVHLYGMMDYGMYFMLGYYFSTEELHKRNRDVIYILGILLTVCLNTNVASVSNYQGLMY